MTEQLVPGYDELYEHIASAVRVNNFAERVINYIFEENPARLEYDIRSEMARHIMRLVEDELTKEDASRLLMFAAAVVRQFPPPSMGQDKDDSAEADPK